MNLILTICLGEKYKKISQFTHPTIAAYAKKIGADFKSITEGAASEERWTPEWENVHWEKLRIENFLNQYKRIIYIDTDIIIRDDCENLFDIVPESDLGAFDEMPFTQGRQQSLIEVCKEYGVILPGWDGRYWNTGVMVVPRQWKFIFKQPNKKISSFGEQGYLNMRIHQELAKHGNELRVFNLPYRYNRMTCMDQFTGEERHASKIIHYAGAPNLNEVLSVIENDVQVWDQNKGIHNYKRHILVDVQGGLGDQVNAQPAIRYMVEKIYPGEDIVVVTHFPVLFEDIDGIRVFEHGQFQPPPQIPYRILPSLPGPETITWSIVSNLLCHTVDYCSISLLKRILPPEEKTIKLKVKKECLDNVKKICDCNLKNLTLVHAGKHWPSKTFPIEWWQEVVDSLLQKGEKVCLIGKNELSRGVLPVIAREGIVDVRDLLSLEELIALISEAKCLISNDSAPIHLAGAFDNEIILIPTCKHPSHILPFRYSCQSYKTRAVYQKLTLDDIEQSPTQIGWTLAHEAPVEWTNYLPTPREVCDG